MNKYICWYILYIDLKMKKRGRHRKPLITIQSTKDILIYTFPSVLMMIFTALYGIADGLLASLYIWTDALSSINIVYPYICLIVALGVMIWIWWSASIWEKLWEGKETEARSSFHSNYFNDNNNRYNTFYYFIFPFLTHS